MVLAALEAGEGFTEAIGRRMEACVVVEFDRTNVVLLIFGLSTNLYKQIFRKMRFVVRGLLDRIFFCLKCGSGRIELLVRALGF